MKNWKYTDNTNTSCFYINNGNVESQLIISNEIQEWLAEGNTPLPADQPTSEQVIKSLTDAVQKHMDKEAQKLGYDNIISACSYAAGTTANKYKADGISFLNWRSNVWDYCYTLLNTPDLIIPTEAELIARLPVRA